MVQTLDVISVNIWNIIISLANLLILYFGLKKFLFKPVKNILEKRESEIEEGYSAARVAKESAEADKEKWASLMTDAKAEANRVISDSAEKAKLRSEKILEEASQKAVNIVKKAEQEAELEYKKSADKIKKEIVELSSALAEKMLEREIKEEDHKNLIDSFIEEIGD